MPVRLWIAILSCLLTLWLGPVQAQPVELHADGPRTGLWQHLQVLPDAQDRLSPAEASEQMDRHPPVKLPHANVTFGKWLPDPYWARFELHNPTSGNTRWLIAYEVPTQDDVQLWRKDSTDSGTAWTQVPLREQRRTSTFGSGHLYPVWSIDIPRGANTQYLMQVRGHNLIRFPVYALREEAFVQQQQALHLGLGFVFAVPLVVVLYVLTLVRVAQDKSLPLFLAMAASEMLGAAWVSGLMHELFPWISRWSCGWIGGAGYAAMLGLSCQHAKVFMQTATKDRFSHALLSAGAWFWLALLPALACIYPEAFRLMLVTGGTVHALIMIGLALRGLRRQPGAVMGLFVSVWIVYAVSALLYVLYRVAHLPVYISLMSAFIQGSLVAALLGCAVSLQIMNRRTQMQQQIEAAQNRSLLYAAAHHDLWQPLQSLGL
ncbi:MAG: 7TM-DISM domain-containing protein, partial [Burkholderiaceae bacterium]|nr:7TM-DISM domain-containing protein [Burkholderiaceae bacterium]